METRRGHLEGSMEHLKGKGGESVVVILRFLCGSPCLCRLMDEGLVPTNKYWTYRSHTDVMGSVNLIACCWQMFVFHYCFNGCVERETGWRTCGSLSRVGGLCQEPFFQEQLGPSNAVDGLWKVATYVDCPQKAYARRRWTGVRSVRVMLIEFSPAGCTSIRITVTLRYE
jgi:hypothetical protein